MRIGEILIKSSVIDAKSLEDALSYAGYKQIPLGRALRVLRHITEEDLTRALDAQNAIRKGIPIDVAMDVLKSAYQTNRTFMQSLQNPLAVQTDNIPTDVLQSLSDKKRAGAPVARTPEPKKGEQTHEQLIEMGDTFFLANEIEPAEKAYKRARELVEDAHGVPPSKVAYVLTKLANLYFATDRFKEALPLYERVLEIQTKVFGESSPEVTRAFEDLGDLFDVQDKLPEAQRYYDDALKTMYQHQAIDPESTGRLFKKLVSICNRTGEPIARARLGELATDSGLLAADKVQAALATSKETGKPIGTVLREENMLGDQQIESLMFAQVLVKQGTLPGVVAVRAIKFANARKMALKELTELGQLVSLRDLEDDQYKQLIAEQENMLAAESNLGPNHPDVAAIAQKVAEIHLARKDRAAAEAFFKRAVSILQKASGTDKAALLGASERLAQVYCQYAKYHEAQPLLLKCLEYRQSLGQGETGDTAKCLWLIAKVELAQCNHATALSFMRSARVIYEKLGPNETPKQFLEQMATSCLETGMLTDLEPIFTTLIAMAKSNDRAFEPETAHYMEQLGDYYAESGRSDAAQAQFYASLQIYERAPGSQSRAAAVSKKLAKATEAAKSKASSS
jgi:tetratricopeptide (TPR) repeat protein